MAQIIRFGPAGNSDAFYEEGLKSTVQAIRWVHSFGLNAFEYSFSRGVRLGEKTGKEIGEQAKKYDVKISVHAPYYINLANDKFENNLEYLVKSAAASRYLNAGRVVFHPGSVGKDVREDAFLRLKTNLEKIIAELKTLGFSDIKFCPETMGKHNQLGSLSEIISLCNIDEMLYPTIDFGHLHTRRNGSLNTISDYENVLVALKNGVGEEKFKNMHIHFSHIQYTEKGEKMHLTFEDEKWGPHFEPLAELIAKMGMTPTIICESKGTQAKDACAMKKMYEGYLCKEQRK